MSIKTLTLLGRILDIKTRRKGILTANTGKPSVKIATDTLPIERDMPENTGIPSQLIAEFLNELYSDETLNLHDVIVLKNGKIITEAYFGAQKKGIWKATFSACKSIVSLAVGILIDDGKLSLDSKLSDIFDKEMNPVTKLKMREMNIYHLLTMTSGMTSFEEMGALCEENIFRAYINTSLSDDPGKKFKYNSLNTYMLSAVIKKVSGKSISEFLDERLFGPMGIKDYYWERCKNDIELGGWGLYMLPEDMAKLGLLVMNCGIYEGKRLISEEYVRKASSKEIAAGDSLCGFDYGFQMWCSEDSSQFLFNGMLGQNVWGFRNNGIVIVNHSGNEELFQQSNYFSIVRKYFDKDFSGKIKKSSAGARDLKRMLKKISFTGEKRKKTDLPKECYELNGVRFKSNDTRIPTMGLMPLVWQAVESNYSKGFEGISFEVEGGKLYVNYFETEEEHRFALGFSKAEYTELLFDNAPYLIGASGNFAEDEDGNKVLKMRIDFVETPCSLAIKLYFHKNYVTFYQKEMPGRVIVMDKLDDIKKELQNKPIIGGAAAILDDEVLRYRIERLFEFKINLMEENDKN